MGLETPPCRYVVYAMICRKCRFILLFLLLNLTRLSVSLKFSSVNKPTVNKRSYHKGFVSIRLNKGIQSRAIALNIKAWYEDDLPNILGINPIEAAIIFGVLYYVYGPNVLYEYAREAGKAFSTYAPIVKDVSMDIFNEFRDYFEEDR